MAAAYTDSCDRKGGGRGRRQGGTGRASTMPRRPPRTSAVQMAHTFVHVFMAECTSDDQILPKNG